MRKIYDVFNIFSTFCLSAELTILFSWRLMRLYSVSRSYKNYLLTLLKTLSYLNLT